MEWPRNPYVTALPELNVFDQLVPLAFVAVAEVTSVVHDPPTGRRSNHSVRPVSG